MRAELIATILTALGGLIIALIALWKASGEIGKTRAEAAKAIAEAEKAKAETAHVTLDTVQDAMGTVLQARDEKIARLEARVSELELGREADRVTIVGLNRKYGLIRQAAELQSGILLEQGDEICMLRERVRELLDIVRNHGLPLPRWAMEETKAEGA